MGLATLLPFMRRDADATETTPDGRELGLLNRQPEYQGTITMQVRAHARNEREFLLKMQALADETIEPVVSNGTMHGGLDRFNVDLVRDMRVPANGGPMRTATIEVEIVAPTLGMAQCVAREAVSRIATQHVRPYVQGALVGICVTDVR